MPPKSWWTEERREEQAERARALHRTGKLTPPKRRKATDEYQLAERSLRRVLNAKDATHRERISAANGLARLVRSRDGNSAMPEIEEDAVTILSDGELTLLIHERVADRLHSWRNASGQAEMVLFAVLDAFGLARPNEHEREELRDRYYLKLVAAHGREDFRERWPEEAERLIERGHKLPEIAAERPDFDDTLPHRELREAQRRGLGSVTPEKGKQRKKTA